MARNLVLTIFEIILPLVMSNLWWDGKHWLHFFLSLVNLCDGSYLPCTNRPKSFHFAIVDEVDSVLIDEGRNPLLISGEVCLIVFLSCQSTVHRVIQKILVFSLWDQKLLIAWVLLAGYHNFQFSLFVFAFFFLKKICLSLIYLILKLHFAFCFRLIRTLLVTLLLLE